MQRGRGAIESDIGGDRARLRARVQRLGLRDLMDEAALGQDVEKIGFIRAHCLGSRAAALSHPSAGGVTGPASDSTMQWQPARSAGRIVRSGLIWGGRQTQAFAYCVP